jgi:cytochrome b
MSATVRIWDPLIRVFHWALVASFAIAWISAEEWDAVHEWAGYTAAGLVLVRVAWGLIGPGYARFGQFLRAPRTVAVYLSEMLHHREPRYLGHNPVGGLMIVALMMAMLGVSLTGWLYTTSAFWGSEWLEEAHELLADTLLVMVGIHVAGVVLASLRHGENLVRSMFNGEKRAAAPGDVA